MHPRSFLFCLLASTAPALLASTAVAQALQLTAGIDGGVDYPAHPVLVPPTGLTIEAWITYDDATVPTGLFYWPTIVRQNIAAGQEAYFFRVGAANTAARNLTFTVRVNGANQAVTYAFAPGEFSNYTHVAGTYDGQTLTIYKNGVAVATRTLLTTAELVNSGGVLRVGNGDPVIPGRESWNGDIDELRIWPVARTAAEIQATMGQALAGFPGKVMMFPFDGHTFEVNTPMLGNAFGTVAFVAGAPALAAVTTAINSNGTSSSACARSIDSLLCSVPQVGNSAFAIWAARGPLSTVAPAALVFGSATPVPPGFPPVFSVQLQFDPFNIVYQAAQVPAAGPLGNMRHALPLPPVPAFIGVTLYFQTAFLDPVCGAEGITTSDGLQFTLQ